MRDERREASLFERRSQSERCFEEFRKMHEIRTDDVLITVSAFVDSPRRMRTSNFETATKEYLQAFDR